MTDLRERFRVLDDVRVPDLTGRPHRVRPIPPSDRPPILRRAGIALFAVLAASASFGLLVRAFDSPDPPPDVAVTGLGPLAVAPGPSVPVGDAPSAVSTGSGGVWVAAHPAEGKALHLVRLDPVTGEVVARIPVPALPTWEVGGGGLVALPGAVWVTGGVDHPEGVGCCHAIVYRVDPAGNEVLEGMDLGPGFGADLWIDESGLWVLIFTEEDRGPNIEVVRLDPISFEEIARIPLPTDWAKQVFAFRGSIWVHGNREDSAGAVQPDVLFEIDPTTNRYLGTVPLPGQEFTLAVDGTSVWQRAPTGVVRIDPGRAQVEVELAGAEGHCCSHVVSDGDGGVWVIGRLGPSRVQVTHVTADGRIDGGADADVAASVLGSVAVAFDREHQTLWLAQYEDTVTPLRLTRD